MKNKIKIVAISDTHSNHEKIEIPECDILIHSGDFVNSHTMPQSQAESATKEFSDWISSLKQAKRKIIVPGNHDFFCQRNEDTVKGWLDPSVDMLVDQLVEVNGWKIWGTPWQPNFYNWAYNVKNNQDMKDKLNIIPSGIDILVTHHPPYGILDKSSWGNTCGCPFTLDWIKNNNDLKLHVFGHIHPGYGSESISGTIFCNASIVNHKYEVENEPKIFFLEK